MPVGDLRFDSDPVLHVCAQPVTRFDEALGVLVADMFETMYAANGRGLAAPQIGQLQRVFVTDTTWKEGEKRPICFVNPEISAVSTTTQPGPEACLSIPDRVFEVVRPIWVDLNWTTPTGIKQTARFADIDAICVCHELDHLNGILITDSGTEV